AAAGPREPDRRLRVVLHVDVGAHSPRHEDLGALLIHGALHVGGAADPVLHRVPRVQGAGGDLGPADRLLAEVVHDVDRARHERVEAGDPVAGGHRVRLVAADVQILPRGEVGDLAEHVLDEREAQLAVRVEIRVADTAGPVRRGGGLVLGGLVGGAGRVELGDRVQGRVRVARQVDLGYDRDVTVGRVGDDVGVVLLCVVAGVAEF